MKLGLVRFLNARPLDYGFRRAAERGELSFVEDTPARLFRALRRGELDAALVSSVEVLRNADLGCCRTVGVCAEERVDSIVYLQPEGEEDRAPYRVLTDRGSRSSVALLRILLERTFPEAEPEFEEHPPEDIPERIVSGGAGLLIGDAALAYRRAPDPRLSIRDLAAWWHELEELPFVFALWAYPEAKPLPDSLFEDSLREGEESLEIIAQGSGFPDALRYLAETLHYRVTAQDLTALDRYRDLLSSHRLL